MPIRKIYAALDGSFEGTINQLALHAHRSESSLRQASSFIDFGDTFTIDGTKYALKEIEDLSYVLIEKRKTKCKDVSTGQIFDSCTEAALSVGGLPQSLNNSFNKRNGK